MKKIVIIIFVVIAIAGLGTALWKVVSVDITKEPTSPTPSFPNSPSLPIPEGQPLRDQQASAGTHPDIARAFMEQTKNTGPADVKLGGTVIVKTYALQAWGNAYSAGSAVFQYDSVKGWQLLTLGGGMPSVPSLLTIGIPQEIALKLVAGM